MEQRGRKGDKAPATVIEGGFGAKAPPPDDLTEEEQAIWRVTVASEPTDFFVTAVTKALLADYCRHRAAIDKVTRVINLFQDEWLRAADGAARYQALLRIRAGESHAAVEKATKLRLTNQSRYNTQRAGTASRLATGRKPWDQL